MKRRHFLALSSLGLSPGLLTAAPNRDAVDEADRWQLLATYGASRLRSMLVSVYDTLRSAALDLVLEPQRQHGRGDVRLEPDDQGAGLAVVVVHPDRDAAHQPEHPGPGRDIDRQRVELGQQLVERFRRRLRRARGPGVRRCRGG